MLLRRSTSISRKFGLGWKGWPQRTLTPLLNIGPILGSAGILCPLFSHVRILLPMAPHRTTCNSKMIHTLSPVHPCISSSICRYLCNSLYRSNFFFLSSCERVCAHFAVDSLTPPLFPHLRMSWKSKTYQDPTWLKRNYCCAACLLTISPTFNKNWYLSFSQRHFFAGCPPTTNSSTQLITKIEPKPL